MAEYIVWHPYETPEHTSDFDRALSIATRWIREHKDKRDNTVTITREDLKRPRVVTIIRGWYIE